MKRSWSQGLTEESVELCGAKSYNQRTRYRRSGEERMVKLLLYTAKLESNLAVMSWGCRTAPTRLKSPGKENKQAQRESTNKGCASEQKVFIFLGHLLVITRTLLFSTRVKHKQAVHFYSLFSWDSSQRRRVSQRHRSSVLSDTCRPLQPPCSGPPCPPPEDGGVQVSGGGQQRRSY